MNTSKPEAGNKNRKCRYRPSETKVSIIKRQVCVFVNGNGSTTLHSVGLIVNSEPMKKEYNKGGRSEVGKGSRPSIYRQHKARHGAQSLPAGTCPQVGITPCRDRPTTDSNGHGARTDAARAPRLYGAAQRHCPQPESTRQAGQYCGLQGGRGFVHGNRVRDRKFP